MAPPNSTPKKLGQAPLSVADRVDQGALLACGSINLTGPLSGD